MLASPRKILFLAEGATLAHVARPCVLASALNPDQFDVVLGRPPAFAWLTAQTGFRSVDLQCIDAGVFAQRLEHGQPLYDFATLARYVEEDLALIDAERPDVVIGDFRLSLSISARLRGVPYITICDAYWSPEQPLRPMLPVLSFTSFSPIPLAALLFQWIAPLALRLHARPLERLRAQYGLPSFGHDLRRCYTDADLRLFANFPVMFPSIHPGDQADFIGPIAWSPPALESTRFRQGERPLAYVTMGSSGKTEVLASVTAALEEAGYDSVVATAGKRLAKDIQTPFTRVFDYLPGSLVCSQASLVVCNGGSPTTNQALTHGVPVLGVAWNMDQFMNMRAIEEFGAGILLRADRCSPSAVREAIGALSSDSRHSQRACALSQSIASDGKSIGDRLANAIERVSARHLIPNAY